jgi:hypothetical protein
MREYTVYEDEKDRNGIGRRGGEKTRQIRRSRRRSLRDKQLQSIEKLVYFFRRKHRGGAARRRRRRTRERVASAVISFPRVSNPPTNPPPLLTYIYIHTREHPRHTRIAGAFITDPVHVRYWPLTCACTHTRGMYTL